MGRQWSPVNGHVIQIDNLAPLRPRAHRWRCSCGAGGPAWVSRRNAVWQAEMHLKFPGTPPLVREPQIEEHW